MKSHGLTMVRTRRILARARNVGRAIWYCAHDKNNWRCAHDRNDWRTKWYDTAVNDVRYMYLWQRRQLWRNYDVISYVTLTWRTNWRFQRSKIAHRSAKKGTMRSRRMCYRFLLLDNAHWEIKLSAHVMMHDDFRLKLLWCSDLFFFL